MEALLIQELRQLGRTTLHQWATQASFLCDFFHVSQYLGAAAPVCRPDHADQPALLRVLRANDQWPSLWN